VTARPAEETTAAERERAAAVLAAIEGAGSRDEQIRRLIEVSDDEYMSRTARLDQLRGMVWQVPPDTARDYALQAVQDGTVSAYLVLLALPVDDLEFLLSGLRDVAPPPGGDTRFCPECLVFGWPDPLCPLCSGSGLVSGGSDLR
jgi:hypothetical protein